MRKIYVVHLVFIALAVGVALGKSDCKNELDRLKAENAALRAKIQPQCGHSIICG